MFGNDLTGNDNWFEDFYPGLAIRHHRAKTIETSEHVMIANLTMNTAQGHFNEVVAGQTHFKQRMVFGGYTAALVIGLAAQDTAEHVIAEIGLDKMRLPTPVFGGDTINAFTEVLAVSDSDRPDAGIVDFRHWGTNQHDKLVFEGVRRALVARRPA